MITMSLSLPVATVTRNAKPVVIIEPMYGMKPPKNERTASGRAKGIPSIVMITNWDTAPKSEMALVPSMYPPSTAKARPPAAPIYDRRPGSKRSRNLAQASGPSRMA